MKKGIFISFEGLDGTGKTTQMKRTCSYLEDAGFNVLSVREPGSTAISEKIRSIILDKENSNMFPETEMLLCAAARAQLVRETILPALESGSIVLCDRYIDSSFAYQGFGRGLRHEDILSVNAIGTGGLMPDLTLLFSIGAKLGMARVKSNRETDRIESEVADFHFSVYEGFKYLKSIYPQRIYEIECQGTEEEVFSFIRHVVEDLLQRIIGDKSLGGGALL